MSKSNIKILLALLSILMVVGVYFYVFKPNQQEKESLESEITTLETKLADLKAKEANRDMYLAKTEEYNEKFDELVAYFPADLNQEVSIMFMKGVEDARNGEFLIDTAGLGQAKQFYTLGGENTDSANYVCYEAAFPISYNGTYAGVKDFVDYIMNYKYRMNISSINISYDTENDVATGAVSMNAYCVTGGDREGEKVDVDVNNGVDNIFLGGTDSPSTQTYSYDSDNGASIADKNDIKITLNNAANDTADGIVVSAGGTATNVTSDENSVEPVALHIYEQDGKNYADYSIGDSKYTVELTGTDVKVYVASSARVDGDDKNGVKLNITNDTDMTVFVKVADDDTTSPRFTLGSKTGTVKVY
ncbi:MAG: hypothetical protein ACI39Q_08090 [Wujia sp.]